MFCPANQISDSRIIFVKCQLYDTTVRKGFNENIVAMNICSCSYNGKISFIHILMGESKTVVSAYKMYRHLQ